MFRFLKVMKQKKLSKLMVSFTKVLTELDAFIEQQKAEVALTAKQMDALIDRGVTLQNEIDKASKVRGNISQLIEE